MIMSPYELLRASKPKPPQTVISDYDLYSLAQPDTAGASAAQPKPIHTDVGFQQTEPAVPPPKKTHYISDIHTRHANAMRRTAQASNPL